MNLFNRFNNVYVSKELKQQKQSKYESMLTPSRQHDFYYICQVQPLKKPHIFTLNMCLKKSTTFKFSLQILQQLYVLIFIFLSSISYPMSSQRPIVQNVVSYGRMALQEQIDLKYLAEKIENSRFNKKRFPALIIRKTKPKCTIMVFKSGKIIVIGSESQKDAELAAKKLGKDIQKALNSKCKLSEFRITNLVANADLGFQIDLHRLADERLAVKDDSFPGVVYRNLKNLKSALIFHSGKVIFTGATLRAPIEQAYDELKTKLRKFEKIKVISKKEETQVEDNNKIDHHSPLKKKR